MPSDIGLLRKIKNLSPSFCLNHIRASFSDLPLVLADNSKLSAMENQYRMLLTIDWQEVFGDTGIPIDGSKFWIKAMNVKDAGGEQILKDLALFALKVYSTPISNAVVERVFSRVTSVKTKLRNRMGFELLSSILRIKTHVELNGGCCLSFQPTPAMLHFDSSMYNMKNYETKEVEDMLNAFASV